MKASVVIASAVLALGAAISMQFAQADTRQANCEVRKNGETKQGKSGPCSFGQRQGYIDIRPAQWRRLQPASWQPGEPLPGPEGQQGRAHEFERQHAGVQVGRRHARDHHVLVPPETTVRSTTRATAARNTSAGTTMPSKAGRTTRTGIRRTTRTATGRVNRTDTGRFCRTKSTDRYTDSRTQARRR